MKAPKFTVTYIKDGIKHFSSALANDDYEITFGLTPDSFTASITSKCAITLDRVDAEFGYHFDAGDRFFGNGYQAWTTTREYTADEKMQDIIPIAVGPLKNLAGISADTRFVAMPKKKGQFISHCYTYVRNGSKVNFIGSLTERQGFTVISADMPGNSIVISKDVEGVTIEGTYDLYNIALIAGTYDSVFDTYFSKMGVAKPRISHLSGYTSWYNYFQKINEDIILRDLNSLDVVSDSVNIFQVDDGYETFVGDWLDPNPEKFPGGMEHIAAEIHKKGYKSGIWLAPFNLQRASRMYKEHPEWVIKDKHGRPLLGCAGWGGAYTMDIYNDEAREYIKHFFDVVLNEWNYDMVKLDFLYSECMYPRNNKSRGTIMCEAMEFLRECCGDKLILGCGVPLGAAFGYVDACRIGCDVDLKYEGKFYNKLNVNNEIPSAQNSINNAVFRRHLNGRVFCNDPDVFFLRYSNLTFTQEQKMLLGSINHLCGGVLFVSDDAAEYTDNDVAACRKFFSEATAKVVGAEYETPDIVVMKVDFGGEVKRLWFNIKTGENNVSKAVLG